MIRRVPLVVILGSTGTGKTKLSLELAERFGAEIISADSMQVYSHLDIATAKATKAEQARVKHHLIDVVQPGEPFTIVDFRNAALSIINNLLAKGTIPIVVGGTNYYIESLLWNILVTEDSQVMDEQQATQVPSNLRIKENLLDTKMTSEELHSLLKTVDPVTANRLHPNNRRKIIRALEVFQKSGKTLSSIFNDQRSAPGGNRLGGPLRFPHTIMFWLQCKQNVLDKRLNKRVDSMVQQGFLTELRRFYTDYILNSSNTEYTKGILQTIGLKEFIPYLEKYNELDDRRNEAFFIQNLRKSRDPAVLNTEESRPEGFDVLESCLDRLKLVTKRYSKKQIKWVKNRILSSRDRQIPDLFGLDGTYVSKWNTAVFSPAANVIASYANDVDLGWKSLDKVQHPGVGLNEETTNYCSTCDRVFIGEFQWKLHLKSNKHKRRKESVRRKAKLTSTAQQTDDIE